VCVRLIVKLHGVQDCQRCPIAANSTSNLVKRAFVKLKCIDATEIFGSAKQAPDGSGACSLIAQSTPVQFNC
jgi:hypothetical protein